jgi:plasmid stabilization system protein ParE
VASRLIWSPTARLDLRSVVEYIAEDAPATAPRVVDAILQAVAYLRRFPESGRTVPEFGALDIREISDRPCRIIYRLRREQELIEVARVWHAARGTPLLPSNS